MKIVYFLGALNRGGAETLILDICKQHAKVPFEFVCVYRHDGNMSEAFKESGAPMIQIQKKLGYLLYLWNIRQTLQREHVAIVHSQTPSNTLLLALALVGTGIKIITTFHGYNFGKTPWWQRKIVYDVSKKILCVSQYQKQYYENLWHLSMKNKLQVVYNGIDFSKFDVMHEGVNDLMNERGIKLCMVGNFVDVRSQIVIVKAIHELKKRGITDFDFYFVGRRDQKEYELYDNCIQYCEDNQLENVHFLGSRGDIPLFLKEMDGFVYSSARDTFGIAVIEAMAAELPVVVNDWEVMKEVSDLGLPVSNEAIRIFKTDDAKDCADKITELLENLQKGKEQLSIDCKSASKAARKKYSIEKHIENLLSVYSNL